MVIALGALERDALVLTPQPETGITYAGKIDKNETRIDWQRPWKTVHDHCRGLSPFPGAWFETDRDKGKPPARVKVLRTTKAEGSGAPGTVLDDRLTIACGEGAVRIFQLQRAGKAPMSAEDFLRGAPVRPGTVLA
jgi:methionyl-tRNA formyltransferase